MVASGQYLELENVKKTYVTQEGRTHEALRGVSLSVKPRGLLGIVGRSGSGKSTLLRMMNGLEHPDYGRVLWQDRDLAHMSYRQLRMMRHRVGMIFQEFHLLQRRRVWENVSLALELHGHPRSEARSRALSCLERVGLEDKVEAYPAALSGGQKQRVAIARALAMDVELLLCDEPTSALDPETTQEILALLKGLHEDRDLGIVFVSHAMDAVRSVCQEVVVVERGCIVEQGSTQELFSNPQHPVSQSLVGSVFTIPEVIAQNLQAIPPEGPCSQVLRLIFAPEEAQKPILFDLFRHHKVPVSIAGGTIDSVGLSTLGSLVVTLPHTHPERQALLDAIAKHPIRVQEVGFIPDL